MKFSVMLIAALIICLCTAIVFAGMYSWTDENGVKHYSNVAPPQEAEEIVEIQGNETDAIPITKQGRDLTGRPPKPVNDSADKGMSLRMAANSGQLGEVERLPNDGADTGGIDKQLAFILGNR